MMLTDFHKRLVDAFNRNKVDFVLIGGHAALVYGSQRTTGDLDLLVSPTLENGTKIIACFSEMDLDAGDLNPSDFLENLILSFGQEPNAVDIINHLKSLSFEEVSSRAKLFELETGLSIRVIDARDLLKEKRSLNRTEIKNLSDQIDILSLQKYLNMEGSESEF